MYSPKASVEHDPRASRVVFRGEEAVFSERHIANERQDQHGDAENHQTEGLGDADHFRSLFIPCVLGSFSLCCYRLGRKPPLLPVTRMHESPNIASYNGIRSASFCGRLHGEDTAARSGLIPPPGQPPPLLTAAAAASPPGSRFNQGDGTEMSVNTCSQLKAPSSTAPAPPAPLHQFVSNKGELVYS